MVVESTTEYSMDKTDEKASNHDDDVKSKAQNGTMSLEEKFLQLEKRFTELEAKYSAIKVKDVDVSSIDENGGWEANPKPDDELDANSSSLSRRVKVVTSKLDSTGERKDVTDDNDKNKDPSESQTKRSEHAALLRKYVNPQPDPPDGELQILDSNLRERLKVLLAHYPIHAYADGKPIIPSPYESIILNWDLLSKHAEEAGENAQDTQVKSDLKALLETIESGSGDLQLDAFLQGRDLDNTEKTIKFDNLWTIFPPGSLVYGKLFLDQEQLLIVEKNLGAWPLEELNRRGGKKPRYWLLKCLTYDFTGHDFQRRSVVLEFKEFTDEKSISSLLPVFPFDVLGEVKRTEIMKRLVARGEKFRRYCQAGQESRLYVYDGKAFLDQQGFRSTPDEDSDSDSERRYRRRRSDDTARDKRNTIALRDSEVMVDFESYYQYGPYKSRIGKEAVGDDVYECLCSDCKTNTKQKALFKPEYDGHHGNEKWEDLQLMLCPPRVLGYILREKQWAQLSVDYLKEPPLNGEEKLDDLYLTNGAATKRLLFGLVKNHGIGEAQSHNKGYELEDLVPDKGKGLVVLLYGNPGVGKTSTAQMIATAARKPLFSVGVADVGTKAKQVEENLASIFDLATTWRAILLIDEADVFLQSRSRGGLGPSAEGSGLVSVFLRVLEYYRGILFLTTNQIAQFDIAVQSRVHIALKYGDLDDRQTKSIFLRFLRQFKDKDMIAGDDFDDMKRYAEEDLLDKHFDGRQIRNIVSSAMGYARGQGDAQMKLKHIKHVVSYVEKFQKDLAGQMREWQKAQKDASLG